MKKNLALTPIVLFMMGMLLVTAPSARGATMDLQLTCDNEQTWADGQWVFYSATVPWKESLVVNFTYTGTLDIDARLFVPTNDVKKEPWDITREGIEKYEPDDYSQYRGVGGFEEVRYENERFTAGKTVYVLLFSFSGIGQSDIMLKTNMPLTRETVPVGGLLGWVTENVIPVTFIFSSMAAVCIVLMVFYRKKYRKYIEAQKEVTAKEKLGQTVSKN